VTLTPPGSDDALVGLNRLATIARLLSGAAHEVNNALQVISGTIEILEMRSDLPPGTTEALARIKAQSARAAAALGSVMLFARTTRGPRGPVNLREIVESSLELRDFAIRRARLVARLEVEPGPPYLVTADRGDLQQVILNLIVNAEQALAGRTGSVLVRLTRDGDAIVLQVIDEGSGLRITPAERVFEPFVTGGDPFDTPGLGLWVSRLLVERHGGRLEAETRETGAVFTVRMKGRG
jgi:signal transduction histidine kinase